MDSLSEPQAKRQYILHSMKPRWMEMMNRTLFSATSKRLQDKAIDQLYGICTGILADGEVSPKEAEFFAEWIRRYAGERPVWPLTEILVRFERIFADGVCVQEECEESGPLWNQSVDTRPEIR